MKSPYSLLQDASMLMDGMAEEMIRETELQVVYYINAAATYPDMSHYQLAQIHIKLADLYYQHGVYGSALEHYQIARNENAGAPVARKIKALERIKESNTADFMYSVDANTVDTELCYNSQLKESQEERVFGSSRLDEFKEKVYEKLREEVQEEDAIYDPEFENELKLRLANLDELSRSEFYRIRASRKKDNIISSKKRDLLTLEAMERSYNHNRKG